MTLTENNSLPRRQCGAVKSTAFELRQQRRIDTEVFLAFGSRNNLLLGPRVAHRQRVIEDGWCQRRGLRKLVSVCMQIRLDDAEADCIG